MTTSTINPNVPAFQSQLDTAPVRANFAAAYSDINALWASVGSGEVFGPVSSTNMAIARFSGVTGRSLLSTDVIIDGSNNVSGINNLTVNGLITGTVTQAAALTNRPDSGMTTGASDNSVPLQSIIDAQVTLATSQNSTLGIPAIQLGAGKYTFLNGVTIRPWIKLQSIGTVEFDFTGVSGSFTAVRCYNDDKPSSDPSTFGASNEGSFLNGSMGCIFINGPGKTTSTIALDVGNTTHGISNNDFKETSVDRISIQHFGTGIHIRGVDTYEMNYIYGGHIESCGTFIQTDSGTVTNAGERLSFYGWGMGTGTNGYVCDLNGFDMTFNNCSLDFLTNVAFQFGTDANSSLTTVSNCHLEHLDGGICESLTASNTYCQLNISNTLLVASSSVTHGASPRQALFRGYMDLDIYNLTVYYNTTWNSADAGMFMIDGNVRIIGLKGIRFGGTFKQLTAASLLLNNDPYFNSGTVGNDLSSAPMTAWTVLSANNITAAVDSAQFWSAGGATQSIKFTETNTSNSYTIISDRINVASGDRLLADIAAYGGTSTGTNQIVLQFLFTSSNASLSSVSGNSSSQNLSTIYGDSADPAYTGTRTWWAKLQGLLETVVPAGYDYAQLKISVSSMAASDVIWLGFAGFVKL